jgi:hypothetical protein
MIDTSSRSKVKSYSIEIRGSIIGTYKTYKTDSTTLTVNVFDRCTLLTVSITTISD